MATSTIRELAAEAGLTTEAALGRLRDAGLPAGHPTQRLQGQVRRQARAALGLRAMGQPRKGERATLSDDDIALRVLRPLLAKGKVGREHTTPIENTYGHGIPDHQKEHARQLVQGFLRAGVLEQKVSQGRCHVWLSKRGRERLGELEATAERAS